MACSVAAYKAMNICEARVIGGSCGDLHFGAERQPADTVADVVGRGREGPLDRLSSLPEVLPALVVDRDGGVRAEEFAQLDGVLGRHRVAQGARHRELDAAEVQERGADVQSVSDLTHAVIEDGVAGDPEHAVFLTVPAQREADHVANDRVAQWRSVSARRGDDLERDSARRGESRGRPRLEAASWSPPPPRAPGGRGGGTPPPPQRAARGGGGVLRGGGGGGGKA